MLKVKQTEHQHWVLAVLLARGSKDLTQGRHSVMFLKAELCCQNCFFQITCATLKTSLQQDLC